MSLTVFLMMLAAAAASARQPSAATGDNEVQAHAVQLFDPSLFGKSTSESVQLLFDKQPGEMEPYSVLTDIRCGRYVAATAHYGKPVTFDDVRGALQRLYGPEPQMGSGPGAHAIDGLWRIESKQLGIHLSVEDEGVGVIYLHFAPNDVVWKSMMKAGAFGAAAAKAAEALDEDDCAAWGRVFASDTKDRVHEAIERGDQHPTGAKDEE